MRRREAAEADGFDEVARLLDAAALRPALWADAVEALREAIPGTRPVMQAIDRLGGQAVPLTAAGWPEGSVEDYVRHYHTINPWTPVLLGAPCDTVLWTEEELPASAFRRTPFYADWLAPIGEAEVATGMKVFDAGGRCGMILMHYGGRGAERCHAAAGRALRLLGPRMRRALDVQRLAGTARLGASTLLDGLAEPALVLDRDLVLHAGNAAGLALVEGGGGLRIGCGDRLRHEDPATAAWIRAAVRAALGEPGAAVPAPGFPRFGGAPHAACVVRVSPPMQPLVGVGPLLLPRTLALLVLRPLGAPCEAEVVRRLSQRYRLTPAEARVALLMDGGLRLGEIADRIGTGYETVRAQARAVYAKTDQRGLPGVAALLARMRREP